MEQAYCDLRALPNRSIATWWLEFGPEAWVFGTATEKKINSFTMV
jgi:hypothetical protein